MCLIDVRLKAIEIPGCSFIDNAEERWSPGECGFI